MLYTGDLAESCVSYLRSRGSTLTVEDFAAFAPEIDEPISTSFGGLTVLTSPPNTHGLLLLRALRAIDELAITDPLGDGLGTLMRVFHRGNALRAAHVADPRFVDVDTESLVNDALDVMADLGVADAWTHARCRTGTPSVWPPPTPTAMRYRSFRACTTRSGRD